MTRAPRVAVVAGFEWVSVSPSTVSAVEMLVEHGYHVDLLVRQQRDYFPGMGISHLDVAVHFYPWKDEHWWLNLRMLGFTLWVFAWSLALRPRLYLALDAESLIACFPFAALAKTPVFYFSLEIWMRSPYPPFRGNPLRAAWRLFRAVSRSMWKSAETVAHKRATLTIIQEPSRAELLRQENRLEEMDVVYVPPSLRNSYRYEDKPNYLRRKFGLGEDQTVILMAGGFAGYNLVHELAREAYHWPDGWVLVVHGWFDESDPYHVELQGLCDGRKVLLSRDMLPQAEFDQMVASADLGLAFYKNVDATFFHITSGKLMQYLRCGVPVIASDQPNLRNIVEQLGCGRCVADAAGVAAAGNQILADFPRYSRAAWTVFDEYFRYDLHFGKVIEKMDALLEEYCFGQSTVP